MWFSFSPETFAREIDGGYEFISIVWLDTCPYDSSKEYCVCRGEVFNTDIFKAFDEFYDGLSDSCCVMGECNYDEAEKYVKGVTKK